MLYSSFPLVVNEISRLIDINSIWSIWNEKRVKMPIRPGGHKAFEFDFCTLLEKRPKRKLYVRIQCSDWTICGI